MDNQRLNYLETKVEQLKTLFEVSLHITSTLDKKILLPRIMEAATKIMRAEASSLMLLDEVTNELFFEVALGDKGEIVKELRVKIGEGICGVVAQTGENLLVNDVKKEPRFAKKFDSTTGFETRSILCVPMKINDKIIGVLEVINRKDAEGKAFKEDDIELCRALGNLAAISIHNADAYKNAITDKLTQLYNFGYFKEQLKKEISRSKRYNLPMSIIMIDIDYFKNYNDKNGHQEGNKALIQTANIITDNARGSDTVARYGGEEFIIMLPQTQKKEAKIFTERIRQKVEETEYNGGKNQPAGKVTISAGIASYPEDAENDEELIVKADNALYYSKTNGRNRVSIYGIDILKEFKQTH